MKRVNFLDTTERKLDAYDAVAIFCAVGIVCIIVALRMGWLA